MFLFWLIDASNTIIMNQQSILYFIVYLIYRFNFRINLIGDSEGILLRKDIFW